MKNNILDLRNVLELIFKTTKKKGNILADCYLIKDSSIISKWKNGKSKPLIEDLSKIVEFTYKESSEMQRKIIRNEIEVLILNSNLTESIKSSLLKISNFKEFLSEVLNVATAGNDVLQEASNPPDKASNLKKLDAMKLFSYDKNGDYTGEVELNLTLSNEEGEKSNIVLKGIGSFRMGIMNAPVKKKVTYASALGVIVVLLFAGLYSFNAGSTSQAIDKKSVLNCESKIEQINFEPEKLKTELGKIELQVSEQPVKTREKIEKKNENSTVQKSEPSKTDDKSNSKVVTEEQKGTVKKSTDKKNVSESDKKALNSANKKNNAKDDSDNTDNSIVIDNSPFVGNNNIIGIGNNISISIDN